MDFVTNGLMISARKISAKARVLGKLPCTSAQLTLTTTRVGAKNNRFVTLNNLAFGLRYKIELRAPRFTSLKPGLRDV